jgi:DNA-binding transcriptional MerR regulator
MGSVERDTPSTAAALQNAGAGVAVSGPFRIQVAAELSGIPAATLRAWERRYGIPVPRRTASAYRLYTNEDVELLRRMRDLVAEGVSPAEAARVVLASSTCVSEDEHVPVDGLDLAQARLLAATQRWDAKAIDDELTRVSMLLDAQTFFERVVSPVLAEVGARWARGDLAIAQEHLLSDRLELAVRATLRTMERSDGPIVLLACIDAEQHVLGVLGAALKFAQNGARTVVLGAMTPPDAMGEAVRNLGPRLVGLSMAIAPPAGQALFAGYGEACGATPWVVGGAAVESQRGFIEAAGGMVAVGSSSSWSSQIRHWLRVAR